MLSVVTPLEVLFDQIFFHLHAYVNLINFVARCMKLFFKNFLFKEKYNLKKRLLFINAKCMPLDYCK